MSGLLLVDKPGLPASPPPAHPQPGDPALLLADGERLHTSHDVVQRVRRLTNQRRIGHTGTLDPMASGLLVLCLGQATRLVEYYQGHDKQYLARITLGFETDTYDLLGRVVDIQPVPELNAQSIEAALATFEGAGMQRPPAYSALKQEGESLHHKARRGEVVEIPERPVTFHRLEMIGVEPPHSFTVRVRSSAGAYIRSLAVDLGRALGTVATLTALRREGAGAFSISQAHELAELEAAAQAGLLEELLLPAGSGLDLPRLVVDEASARRLGHGQRVAVPLPDDAPSVGAERPEAAVVQARDANGRLLGILRALPTEADLPTLWQADKWFAREE
jgi:tRNA pseudouridine55 synthase